MIFEITFTEICIILGKEIMHEYIFTAIANPKCTPSDRQTLRFTLTSKGHLVCVCQTALPTTPTQVFVILILRFLD